MPSTRKPDMPMHRSQVGEVTLAHRVLGEGEPVLLIHGALVADTMQRLAEAPALGSFRRIVYHRRGYGDSPAPMPARPTTLAEFAEDALGLLDHVDGGAAHVVGHSMGAMIGLELAAGHPERVRSLALLEPPTPFARPAGAAWLAEAMPLAESYAAGDVRGAVHGFFETIYKPDWQHRMERELPGAFEQSVLDAASAFESDLPGVDWENGLTTDQVAAIRCPILSVLGTDSGPLFSDGRRILHDWFPWCQDADIENGDHMLPIEYADAVASAIEPFVARAGNRTT